MLAKECLSMRRQAAFPVGVLRLVVILQFSRQIGGFSDSMAGPGFSRGFRPSES
jgi:hypothetical protein